MHVPRKKSASSIDDDDDSLVEIDPELRYTAFSLRDPLRRYEAVGGPVMAVIYATRSIEPKDIISEEKKYKLVSLHVAGAKVRGGEKRNLWDSERQKLTAMQWLVAYGLGKAGKKGKLVSSKGQDLLWSISSRVMADMWLKRMRNLDVKISK